MRSPRLEGRDNELEHLRRTVAAVRSGDPCVLLIEGEAGIGKTRLVTDAVIGLKRPGDLAAVGHGVDLRSAGSTDPQPWRAAADAWDRIEQLHEQAWALLRLAECHVTAGRRQAVRVPVSQALLIGQRLRARPLTDAAAWLARRARLDLAETHLSRSEVLPLTEREISVLELMAAGRSNSQIAREMFISPKTASVHVSHILTKLGVHTRTEAAAIAYRRHLLDHPH